MKKGDTVSYVVQIAEDDDLNTVAEILRGCMRDTRFCPDSGLWKITFEPCDPVGPLTDGINPN